MSEEIHYSIGRLEAKMDTILRYREEHLQEHIRMEMQRAKDHGKLETKVEDLDKLRWKIIGGAGVISACVPFIIKWAGWA
jgi:hypothetical protein